MKRAAIIIIAACALAAVFAAPRPAAAWEPQTHLTAADTIISYYPQQIRDIVNKYKDQYHKGVQEEPELYDSLLKTNDKYDDGIYVQKGLERILYHVQRIQFFLDKKTNQDLLAYTIGQFVHCAMDLLEPMPSAKAYGQLEISADRMYFQSDYLDNNKKIDFMNDGRSFIDNFPAALDTLLQKNKADADQIYSTYHSQRNFKAIDSNATAAMNRSLNFIVDSVNTFVQLLTKDHSGLLDIRAFLGLDRYDRANNGGQQSGGVKAPNAPKKPTPPSVQKNKKK